MNRKKSDQTIRTRASFSGLRTAKQARDPAVDDVEVSTLKICPPTRSTSPGWPLTRTRRISRSGRGFLHDAQEEPGDPVRARIGASAAAPCRRRRCTGPRRPPGVAPAAEVPVEHASMNAPVRRSACGGIGVEPRAAS